MEHRVGELEGAFLDAAVAMARGAADVRFEDWGRGPWCITAFEAFEPVPFRPSSHWSDGGPIIERERIELMFGDAEDPGRWSAYIKPPSHAEYRVYLRQGGPTALVAAMRAYVASRMGETVELP